VDGFRKYNKRYREMFGLAGEQAEKSPVTAAQGKKLKALGYNK
jgi:hypothetical protein